MSTERTLPLSEGRTAARLARHVEVALQPFELSLAQYRILGMLASGAEVPSSLAANLAVSAPSITTVVDGLVARSLVERRHGEGEDRRRVSHLLTGSGAALVSEADAAVAAHFGAIAALLGDPRRVERAHEGLELWRQALVLYREQKVAEQTKTDHTKTEHTKTEQKKASPTSQVSPA